MEDYLIHYGVLGMKWGVRRYQNEDGTLTAAGKKRYDTDVDEAKKRVKDAKSDYKDASKKYAKASAYGLAEGSKKAQKALKSKDEAQNRFTYEKDQLRSERIKERLNSETSKSKRRLALEEGYKAKGFSQEDAEIAAYKRAQTEKILAVTAGVTVASIAAYVAYKHYDETVDRIIPKGTSLQHIAARSDKGITDAFYTSYRKMDNNTYIGEYGKHLSRTGNGDVFKGIYSVSNDIKVASIKSATPVLQKVFSQDPSAKDKLKNAIKYIQREGPTSKQAKVLAKALKDLDNNKITDDVYKAYNFAIPVFGQSAPAYKKLRDDVNTELKKLGYGAMRDINDNWLSNYNTKSANIIINGAKDLTVKSITKLSEQEINSKYSMQFLKAMGHTSVKTLPIFGAVSLANKGLDRSIYNKNNQDVIAKYRKQHPDTNLSDKEILANYYRM